MRIIFIHQNMPGQYRGLMPYFAGKKENEVVAIGETDNIRRNFIQVPQGLKLLGYQMPKLKEYTGHPFLSSTDNYTYRGEALARVLVDLKKQGFKPDVICSHPGWGESLYIKDVYPDTRLINYCEFFYGAQGRDFNFDSEFPERPQAEWNLRTRNAIQLLSLNSMDTGISPMQWQASSYPKEYQSLINVIHEGVDTKRVAPDPNASISLKGAGITLSAKDEVITFVSRNLEPYRGFHIFMRALPELMAARPKARFLIVGGDEVSYGKTLSNGTYRQMALNEVGSRLDMARVHFLGKIPYSDYLRVLQISTAHVYLTYPFVLSWSMLEAMSAGCVIVGSRTPPVMEVLEHEKNGLLVDFFSPKEITETVIRVCESKNRMQELRDAARRTITEKFDFETICLPQHINLVENRPLNSKGSVPRTVEIKPSGAMQHDAKPASASIREAKPTASAPILAKSVEAKQVEAKSIDVKSVEMTSVDTKFMAKKPVVKPVKGKK
jgi:glycosyltransferase involved in cell wall biosynthesis